MEREPPQRRHRRADAAEPLLGSPPGPLVQGFRGEGPLETRPATAHGQAAGLRPPRSTMDHYIPKRRIPVTLWSNDLQGLQGSLFLDLDAAGNRHQTVLEKLNESAR